MFLDDDLDVLFEYGSICVFDGQSFNGNLSAPGSTLSIGEVQVQSREYTLEYRSDRAVLVNGSALTIDGVAFKVREVTPQDDGKVSRVTLKKVAEAA